MALAVVAVVAVSGLVAWRWWLDAAGVQRQADREVTLAVARAAPVQLAQLEARVTELSKRLDNVEGWDKPRR